MIKGKGKARCSRCFKWRTLFHTGKRLLCRECWHDEFGRPIG